jgi:CRP-like cAMP-binding protein/SAM-dependent methyltransferase
MNALSNSSVAINFDSFTTRAGAAAAVAAPARAGEQRGVAMPDALSFFADLADADVAWILSSGVEQQVIANTVVVQEGEIPRALYLVLDGLVEVRVQALDGDALTRLRPGAIIGEMSFLDDSPASATVRAVENTLLLSLDRAALDAKFQADPAFATRLYRAFGRSLSRRLRTTHGTLGRAVTSRSVVEHAASSRWQQIAGPLGELKRMLLEADRHAIQNDGEVPAAVAAQFRAGFDAFAAWLNEQLGDGSSDTPEVRQQLGVRLQQELLPFLMLTKNGERWYSKPRGYAGDFLSIEWMYEDRAEGAGRLGPLLDRCFLDLAGAKAVRNRRGLLVEEIRKAIAESGGAPTRVLSMASGPARELFDVFAELPNPDQLSATCLDIDLQALAFVADVRDRRKLKRNLRLENRNLVYLATGRQELDLPPLDLAYSIGLIDYFNDAFVVRLLDYVYDHLRPGGRVILGNFHPQNPSKAVMDHVFDWRLIHRDEADMNRLFRESKFGRPCEEIRYEAEGINLFAIGRRPA